MTKPAAGDFGLTHYPNSGLVMQMTFDLRSLPSEGTLFWKTLSESCPDWPGRLCHQQVFPQDPHPRTSYIATEKMFSKIQYLGVELGETDQINLALYKLSTQKV